MGYTTVIFLWKQNDLLETHYNNNKNGMKLASSNAPTYLLMSQTINIDGHSINTM